MKEKLKQIENCLLEDRLISLGKQCKNEYIVYIFYDLTQDSSIVEKMYKIHFSDNSLKELKRISNVLINRPFREVINNDIYELLLKGYNLLYKDIYFDRLEE